MAELHEVLTGEPPYQQITREIAEQATYRDRYVARRVRVALEHQRAIAEWEPMYEQAVRRGEEPPPRPPDPPEEPDLGGPLTTEAGVLQDRRRAVIAQLAPRVRAAALAREQELLRQWWRTPPAKHRPILEELGSLAVTMREVERDSASHREQVTAVDVAIVAGGRLTDLDVPLRVLYSDDAGGMRSLLYLPRYTPSVTRKVDPDWTEPPPPAYSKEADALLRGARKLTDPEQRRMAAANTISYFGYSSG